MSTFAPLPFFLAALAAAPPSPSTTGTATAPATTATTTATATTTTATTTTAARRVLVAPSGDVEVDAAVRAGVGGDGVVLVDEAATAAVLSDARAIGVVCASADGACWWRLAELSGFDVVVYVAGDVVTAQSATSTRAASVAKRKPSSWTSATRRAFGVAGEVRVKVSPATASVTIDGADVVVDEGVAVASVPGGTHRVLARAPGFADADSAVGVGAGAVVDVAVELLPAATPEGTQGPWLVGAGIGVVAVTAVAVGGLLAWGQVPYLACYDAAPPAGCAVDGEITQTANTTAWAALATGVVGGLVGGGAIVAGVVHE